jgi:hypothetical protein
MTSSGLHPGAPRLQRRSCMVVGASPKLVRREDRSSSTSAPHIALDQLSYRTPSSGRPTPTVDSWFLSGIRGRCLTLPGPQRPHCTGHKDHKRANNNEDD